MNCSKSILITVLCGFFLAGPAFSKAFHCKFTEHRLMGDPVGGPGTREFLLARLGTEVKINTSNRTFQEFREGAWNRKQTFDKVVNNSKFTTYKRFEKGKFRVSNKSYSFTFRYRIYNDGKIQLVQTQPGNYVPIEATGTCKEITAAKNIKNTAKKQQTNNLSKTQTIIRKVQMELNRIGCDVGSADGSVGPASKRGLKKFAEANNSFTNSYNITVFTNKEFLSLLQSKSVGFCE